MGNALALPSQMKDALETRRDEIEMLLPEGMSADRFIRTALIAVTKNPDIQQATQSSVVLSIMEAGRVGLMPDGKEAAIIKYGDNAEFMPMVQGLIRLILRSPGVLKVEARAVRDGDHFEYSYGLHPRLDHEPNGGDDREVIAAYAIVWREATEPTFEVVRKETIEDARLTSRAPNSPAWKNWYGEMARKVALKRLSKYLDLSPEASRAIAVDHAITGSDEFLDYSDGPSDEYRNLLTKNATEQNLGKLKARMTNGGEAEATDGQDTEADANGEGEGNGAEDTGGNGETEGEQPEGLSADEKIRPWKPALVFKLVEEKIAEHKGTRRDVKVSGMEVWEFAWWMLKECFPGDPQQNGKADRVAEFLIGKSDTDEWTGAESRAILAWLRPKKDAKTKDYKPAQVARREARAIVIEQLRQMGEEIENGE